MKRTKRRRCDAANAVHIPKRFASHRSALALAPSHRLSAGFVVATTALPTRFLLLRAYRNWDLPKGLVEPHEDPWTAAQRELAEETGLCVGIAFPYGRRYIETAPYAGGKVARFYLATSDTTDVVLGIAPALGRPEHHEFRWLEFVDARALLVERLQQVLDWAAGTVSRYSV